jgi:dethiobiotin synthetase
MRGAALFVTGTDTGVGKTWVSCGLMAAAAVAGLAVAGMKPVAAGCRRTPEGLRNDDAEALLALATVPLDYATVNPIALEPPVAPHLAAAEVGARLAVAPLAAALEPLRRQADLTVVEGAGGWLVPLNETETLADLAVRASLPVLLVVGVRLGCLNHALLTAESITARGLPLLGWVANVLDDSARAPGNVETLAQRLPAPLLAVVPRLGAPRLDDFAAPLAASRAHWLRG